MSDDEDMAEVCKLLKRARVTAHVKKSGTIIIRAKMIFCLGREIGWTAFLRLLGEWRGRT